ncbi:MAG: CYTH domain-containing protein [Oscillospiraceae bacterium]|nr:CYTH domain-containing protein [Oscillospiraceae bacterium]
MGIEFEVKFRAEPAKLQQLDREIPGEKTVFTMETTYYDTPEKDLSCRHMTLRRRLENGVSVCTLKTPAGDFGRREYELHCPDIETAIPMLCKLAEDKELPLLLQKGVAPLCGAKFTRLAKTVILPEGVVELALDEGFLTGGGKTIVLCEIEVELKEGPETVAIEYAKQLAKTYGLSQEKKSKFRRAKELAEGDCDGV